METSSICELRVNGRRVKDLASPNAVLFLWATAFHYRNGDAERVARAWGFPHFAGEIVWDKIRPGNGNWVRAQHEYLLVYTRGTIHVTTDVALRSVYSIKRSPVPSRKPDEFYGLIAKATPGLRRIELFNRARKPNETTAFDKHGAPKGFEIWGYEAARRRKAP